MAEDDIELVPLGDDTADVCVDGYCEIPDEETTSKE